MLGRLDWGGFGQGVVLLPGVLTGSSSSGPPARSSAGRSNFLRIHRPCSFAAEAASRSGEVVGEHGLGDGRRSQAIAGMLAARGGRSSVGDGIIAGSRSLSAQTILDLRLNGIHAQILPPILYLDVGKCKAIL